MLPYKLDTTNDLLTSRVGLLAIAQVKLCKKPSIGMPCGKPNPLNPPCQGDLSLNSPLIRGVRNDKYWFFAQSQVMDSLNGLHEHV